MAISYETNSNIVYSSSIIESHKLVVELLYGREREQRLNIYLHKQELESIE